MDRAEVTELVKSIVNRCLIYLLIEGKENEDLLPTLLEDIYQDAQEIVLGFCEVKND